MSNTTEILIALEHCHLLIDSIVTSDLVGFNFDELEVYEPREGIGQYRAQTLRPISRSH
jgi:hypothetical protein